MNTYLLFKSLHLIAVISWMAGLLYLPRIFVYHAENNSEVNISEIFKTMERKLYFYIMTPAMILSWLFGLILFHSIGFQQLGQTWMLLKLLFVIIITFLITIYSLKHIVRNNWAQYRCDPFIMPFSGFFGYDPVKNFNNCIRLNVNESSKPLLSPFEDVFAKTTEHRWTSFILNNISTTFGTWLVIKIVQVLKK